jgi:hypothetical protein
MKWLLKNRDKKNDVNKLWFEEITLKKLLFSHGLSWDSTTSLRKKLRLILRSNLFHLTIIMLVVIDLIFVAAELTITAEREKNRNETTKDIFKYISLSILCLFMIEIVVKIFVLRKEMFKSKADLFDASVVIVSFAFDVTILIQYV